MQITQRTNKTNTFFPWSANNLKLCVKYENVDKKAKVMAYEGRYSNKTVKVNDGDHPLEQLGNLNYQGSYKNYYNLLNTKKGNSKIKACEMRQ